MKEYRVEARTYYSKMSTNKDHVSEASQEGTQEIIDQYTAGGWRLASTDSTAFGQAIYIHLYFERETAGPG